MSQHIVAFRRKRTPLAGYGIIYFATHGLFSASEVVQLKRNADWLVLSACNTIAGDRPGAEALSGLARSSSMPERCIRLAYLNDASSARNVYPAHWGRLRWSEKAAR